MASSGTIWAQQVGSRPRLSIYWRAVRQDIPNNRTEIEATLRLHSTYSLYFSANKSGSLDGTAFTYASGFSGTGQVNLSTKKFWVSHNSDGTKSQSISGSFNIAVTYSGTWLGSLSVSGSMSLDRIPRGSSLDSASITALKNGTGSTLTIGRTVHSSSFYHLVSIHDGTTHIWSSGYISDWLSTTHTIPSSTVNTMLNRMGSVTSKSYIVRLRTYTGSGGSGLIGNVTRNVTVSVHSDVRPTVNSPSVNISGEGRDKAIGKYIQSFSRVEASVSGSAGYGSSVSAYNITVRRVGGSDSQSISGASGTTSRPVALSGSYEVIGTITDTRGRSNTGRATFTVDAYSPPSITAFTAVRDESAQTTVNITRATTHSVLGGGGNNNLSYSVQRRIGTGSWTNVTTNGSGTITASPSSATSTSTGNEVTSSYEFRYVVTDQFGGRAESVVNVSTQRVVLDIHKNEGVGIGKIHEQGVLDVDGPIYSNGVPINYVDDLDKFGSPADTTAYYGSLEPGTYYVTPDTLPNQPTSFGFMVVQKRGLAFNLVWYPLASGGGAGVFIKDGNQNRLYPWTEITGTRYTSNENGEAWRFTDGLMICTGIVESVISGSAIVRVQWTHPHAFNGKPMVTIGKQVVTNNIHLVDVGYNRGASGNTGTGIVFKNNHTNQLSGYADIIAIGRWK